MSPCVLITCDFLQLVGYSACRTGPLARKPQSPWARLNTDTSTSPVSSMVGQSGPLYQPVGRTVDGQWLCVSGRYAKKIKDIGHHALPTSLGHRPQHPRGWTCSLCIFGTKPIKYSVFHASNYLWSPSNCLCVSLRYVLITYDKLFGSTGLQASSGWRSCTQKSVPIIKCIYGIL